MGRIVGAIFAALVAGACPARAQDADPPGPPPDAPCAPSVRLLAEAHALGVVGLVPEPTVGFVAALGVELHGFEATLGAFGLAATTARLATDSTQGIDVARAAARLRLGYAIDLAPVALVPSIALDVGGVWATPSWRPAWTGTMAIIDLTAGMEARLYVHELVAISAFLHLAVPLVRPVYEISGVEGGEMRSEPVGGMLGLGLVFRP